MDEQEIQRKIEELQRRHSAVVQKKAGVAGQLQAKQDELKAIVQEIREAGFDPKKITQERDRVQGSLESMIKTLDQELTEVETALAAFTK
jgi:hypothetical protein